MKQSKHWLQSKTILFNVFIAVLAVLTEQSDSLRPLLSSGNYTLLMVGMAIGNTYLRSITSTAVTTTDRSIFKRKKT